MKNIVYSTLAVIFSLSGCTPQKKLVENVPFETGNVVCQSWTGGRAESGSGIRLDIELPQGETEGIQLQQAFFRGKVANLSLQTKGGQQIASANFVNNNRNKSDLIMDADSKKEVGNQPPELLAEFPFDLQPTECVVSYLEGKKLRYHKLGNIQETKPLIYK